MFSVHGNSLYLTFVLMAFWLIALMWTYKAKLTAFKFALGSSGTFVFAFVLFKGLIANFCTTVLMNVMSVLSMVTGMFRVSVPYKTMIVDHGLDAISMIIDVECSGMIETLVIISIIWFYPLFKFKEKIILSIIGYVYTLVTNAIRLLIIITVLYVKGSEYYYIAHSVVGRVVFWLLTIFLYFYILTYKHIKSQKVGNFDYN